MSATPRHNNRRPVPDDDSTIVLRRSGEGARKYHRPDGTEPACGCVRHNGEWIETTLRQCVFYEPCQYCWEVADVE